MESKPQFDEFVPDPQVRKELGNLSHMTPYRWDRNPETAPPGWQPPVKIGRRNHRTRSMVETVKANLLKAAIQQRGA
jgi:hypothetical protein